MYIAAFLPCTINVCGRRGGYVFTPCLNEICMNETHNERADYDKRIGLIEVVVSAEID
jgi:hypothetical protein